MMSVCAPLPEDTGFVRGMLSSVDCNVRGMTEAGYHAISSPDSQIAAALTALMTIYVATLGLRMLMGLSPLRIGDLTISAVKLGLVLALATNWPTYQVLVFDTLFRGPEQIAASVMHAIQPSGSALRGNPFDGLQIVFDQLQASSAFFVRISQPTASPLVGGPAFAAFSLNIASYVTAFATLGVVLAAKIVLAILLALGPLFAGFLLFESTRGLFEGWLKAALAFALVPLFATFALTIELALLSPVLEALVRMRESGEPNMPAAAAAFMLTIVFAAVSLAGIFGLRIIASSLKFPQRGSNAADHGRQSKVPAQTIPLATAPLMAPVNALPQRVAALSAALASSDRRDRRRTEESAALQTRLGLRPANPDGGQYRASLGWSYRRSARPPVAQSSARRDR